MSRFHWIVERAREARMRPRARIATIGILLTGLLAVGVFVGLPGPWFPARIADDPAQALDVVLVADFSGPNRAIGEDLARGFQDALNARGAGPVALRVVRRDDQSRPEASVALAEGAASGHHTLALVGPSQPRGYRMFAAAAEEGEVPVLVPVAPPSESSDEGKWVYTLQPSQQQQAELAVRLLLRGQEVRRVTFLSVRDAQSGYWTGIVRALADVSTLSVTRLEVASDMSEAAIAAEAASLTASDFILMDLPAALAVPLVRALRDAGHTGRIVGFGEMALPGFATLFRGFPREQLALGHYTNGLLAVSAFSVDETDERSRRLVDGYHTRTGTDPSWAYAYGYDAGRLLLDFVETRIAARGDAQVAIDPAEWRAALREFLAASRVSANPTSAFTGPIVFDGLRQRDARPTLLVFRDQRPVPFTLQFSRQSPRVESRRDAQDTELSVGELFYDVVPIVFTGIRFNSIGSLDFDEGTYRADFDLWFRSSVRFTPEDVVFPGAVDGTVEGRTVQESETGGMRYQRIRFQGRFRFSATPKDLVLERIRLPLAWRHGKFESSQLGLVIDAASFNSVAINSPIHEQVARDQAISPQTGYTAVSSLLGVETRASRALGDPRAQQGRLFFSEAALQLVVESSKANLGPTLARRIPWQVALTVAGVLVVVGAAVARARASADRRKSFLRAMVPLVLWTGSLFLFEVALFGSAALTEIPQQWVVWVRHGFSLCYYLAVASMANGVLWWMIRRSRGEKLVQSTIQLITASLIFFGAFAAFYTNVLGRDFLPILATSSVLLTVVGLALRELILDAISGVAIHLEGAVEVGQWIYVRTKEVAVHGVVESLGWRAIRIRSRDDRVHFVPNSSIFQHVVSNFSLSRGFTRVEIPFEVSSSVDIARIAERVCQRLTQVLADDPDVDHTRAISIVCRELDGNTADMVAQVHFRADKSADALTTRVLEKVGELLQYYRAMPVQRVSLAGPPGVPGDPQGVSSPDH